MRVIIHSVWIRSVSAYGRQTRHLAIGLQRAGYEVLVSTLYGIQGRAAEVDGVVHLPGALGPDDNGYIALPMHVRAVSPDVVITLADVWPLQPQIGQVIEQAGSRWVPWVPVDHDPCPPAVVRRLEQAHQVVAMSRFGQQRLAANGLEAVFIPHGVQTSVFRPVDQQQARRKLRLPADAFVVAMVQANSCYPPRKAFQQQFEGFARFHRCNPESVLYLHTWEGKEMGGIDLPALASALDIQEAIICLDRYQTLMGVPDENMAEIYSAADVTLNATAGEGFGVPIIESLACGTPVIVTDFSAMSELCPEGVGWRVGWSDRFFTALQAWQVWPHPEQIADALEAAYNADRKAMLGKCVEFARQFDADRLVEDRWVPLLQRLTAEDAGTDGDTIDIG
jgi:glycosyltransferase involved in cell wall biosynthesis